VACRNVEQPRVIGGVVIPVLIHDQRVCQRESACRSGVSGVGEPVGGVPVSMICPAKVSRSTMAAHRRGSVKVFVHEENGSLEAIATAERSHRRAFAWR
jgi:hypothetical protein